MAGMQLTKCCWKWDSLPSDLVYFIEIHVPRCLLPVTMQRQGKANNWQTLVCVSIHLECWLGKSRVETVTWAAVGEACQEQFSYNLVINFGSVNVINVDSICIRCATGECKFSSHSNRIQCEKALRFSCLSHLFYAQSSTFFRSHKYFVRMSHPSFVLLTTFLQVSIEVCGCVLVYHITTVHCMCTCTCAFTVNVFQSAPPFKAL